MTTASGSHAVMAAEIVKLHRSNRELAEALLANWEHTDDKGRKFYCNCPAYSELDKDSSKDSDKKHSTGCVMARAALHKAGVK